MDISQTAGTIDRSIHGKVNKPSNPVKNSSKKETKEAKKVNTVTNSSSEYDSRSDNILHQNKTDQQIPPIDNQNNVKIFDSKDDTDIIKNSLKSLKKNISKKIPSFDKSNQNVSTIESELPKISLESSNTIAEEINTKNIPLTDDHQIAEKDNENLKTDSKLITEKARNSYRNKISDTDDSKRQPSSIPTFKSKYNTTSYFVIILLYNFKRFH